ncbi:hypothetical protein AcV5_003063 [Taiwanofungus camphoratus]|nr:hypothetical protein AcV5_003063 [Antrodia cinnamomea]
MTIPVSAATIAASTTTIAAGAVTIPDSTVFIPDSTVGIILCTSSGSGFVKTGMSSGTLFQYPVILSLFLIREHPILSVQGHKAGTPLVAKLDTCSHIPQPSQGEEGVMGPFLDPVE